MRLLCNRILPFLLPLLLRGCFGSGEKSTVERQYHFSGEKWSFPCMFHEEDSEYEQNKCEYTMENGHVQFVFFMVDGSYNGFTIFESIEDIEIDGIKPEYSDEGRLVGPDGDYKGIVTNGDDHCKITYFYKDRSIITLSFYLSNYNPSMRYGAYVVNTSAGLFTGGNVNCIHFAAT